jgi:hypothetical protein
MIYVVVIKKYMLFFSYLNTFTGMLFWFFFVLRREYPMIPVTLAVFLTKLVADILAAIVYVGEGGWMVDVFAVLLPSLDFLFVVAWILKARSKRKLRQIALVQA